MANEFTSVGDLTGFFYEVYDKIVDPIPESAKFMAKVPFKGGALELGNKLHVNVVVSDEGGFSYAGRAAGAFNVNVGVSFETQDAQVDAYQLLLQGSVDYESAARASSSRKAFLELVGKKLQVMVASTKRRYESELLYGQHVDGLAVIHAVNGQVLTIEPDHWAPQIWMGKKGHIIDIYGPARTDAAEATGLVISAVNLLTQEITVVGALGATAAGDVIVWHDSYGATREIANSYTCNGAFVIAANTGTLFNIPGAQYDVWQGNVYDAGATAISFEHFMAAMGRLATRGLEGDVVAYVNPTVWSKLLTQQAGLRRYGAEITTDARTGSKAITFFYQTGKIEVIGHGMIKQGKVLIVELPKWKRIGAQDFSFKTPGLEEGRDIFWHDPLKAGFSYRYYGAQALFCEMPSHQLVMTNFTYTTP